MSDLDPNKLENGSWGEWRRLVLNELSRLNNDIEDIKNNMNKLEIKFATEATKLTLYATFGGVIIGAVASPIAVSIAVNFDLNPALVTTTPSLSQQQA